MSKTAFSNMDSTKKSEKTRQPITVAMKKEIIKKYEEGATITQLCRLYDRNKSTIGTIIKDKDKFNAATAPQGITKLVKTRNSVTDKMENLLMNYFDDRVMAFFWETQKSRLKQATMDKFFFQQDHQQGLKGQPRR